MEVAHAQLSSLTRNFIVKYADDQNFDFQSYKPLNENPHKLDYFRLLNVDNTRMKHLQHMARYLLIELNGGYADLSDRRIEEFINDYKRENGVGDESFEEDPKAKVVLKVLRVFYEIFKDDPMYDSETGIKELSVEYFIISIYMLVRHLSQNYIIDASAKDLIRGFLYDFHNRWKTYDESSDTLLLTFSNHRQQGESELQIRDQIIRQIFFEYAEERDFPLKSKDQNRAFSELQKIQIYRNAKGICHVCLGEGKSEADAKVSWRDYEADHILPHSKGGRTEIDNGALLCRLHNRLKSDS